MTYELDDWQIASLDAILRRCEAMSDYSVEAFASVMEQMGFTIARRTDQSDSERARRNCSKITPHAAHDFSDYALLLRCPGVSGKPITQKRGPEFVNLIMDELPEFQRCTDNATHLPHGRCPGKESTEEGTMQIPSGISVGDVWLVNTTLTTRRAKYIHEKYGDWVVVTALTIDEEGESNAVQFVASTGLKRERGVGLFLGLFIKGAEDVAPVGVGTQWLRREPSERDSNECAVLKVHAVPHIYGKMWYVNYKTGWGKDVEDVDIRVFLDMWEPLR